LASLEAKVIISFQKKRDRDQVKLAFDFPKKEGP
jgi:hypothetical protein